MDWVHSYCANQGRWDEIIGELFPKASLLKWGKTQRVYLLNKKIFKIQINYIDNNSLKKEYEINKICEGVLWDLQPRYRFKSYEWEYMELNHLTGPALDSHIANSNGSVLKLNLFIRALFYLSKKGIVYKQLRGRHIYIDELNRPVFIDFGSSIITSPIISLLRNFSLFSRESGRWALSRFGYIFCAVIRQKIFKKKKVESMGCIKNRPHESFLERSILFQHKKNCDDLKLRKTKEKVMRYDGFENWKRSICVWFKKNPNNYMDLLRWEFESDVRIWGGEHWGVIWDEIRRKVPINGKSIVECGFSMGLAAVHARLDGAKSVLSFQSNLSSLDVGEAAQRFFLSSNIKHFLIEEKFPITGSNQLIGLALSIHENETNWSKVYAKLSSCTTIVRRSTDGIEIIENTK